MILLPRPKQILEGIGNFRLDFDAMITMDLSCPMEARVYAQMLAEEIAECEGAEIILTRGSARKGDIRLCVDAAYGESSYQLSIEGEGFDFDELNRMISVLEYGDTSDVFFWYADLLRQSGR